MTDRSSDSTGNANRPGGAARRPETDGEESEPSGKSGAGREAFRVPPGRHDRESQSNYGGGGAHGGTKGTSGDHESPGDT